VLKECRSARLNRPSLVALDYLTEMQQEGGAPGASGAQRGKPESFVT
jgi:hypothetical protein